LAQAQSKMVVLVERLQAHIFSLVAS